MATVHTTRAAPPRRLSGKNRARTNAAGTAARAVAGADIGRHSGVELPRRADVPEDVIDLLVQQLCHGHARFREHWNDQEGERYRDNRDERGEPVLALEEDEGDRYRQEGEGLEGERDPQPPPCGTRAVIKGSSDPIEHRAERDQVLWMAAQGDRWQRDRHHAENGDTTTDVGDPHAAEPSVGRADGQRHGTQIDWPGHPVRRRVQDCTRVGKRETGGEAGDRCQNHLQSGGGLECPVEHVDVPIAAGKGHVGRVDPVLPEIAEGGDAPPLAEPTRDRGVEHGESHGTKHRRRRHHERHLPAAECLGDRDERSFPAHPFAGRKRRSR